MKILLVIAAVVATIGIAVYQFGFQKIQIEPGSLSGDEMTKSCDDSLGKNTTMTPAQAAQMKIACACMMDASATALNKKDGITAIDWVTEVQQNTANCMAKAGISTQ